MDLMKDDLTYSGLSDIGKVRSANEDYSGIYSGGYGHLFVVCDGMGGYKGGANASYLAVATIKNYFDNLPKSFSPSEAVKNSLIAANNSIIADRNKYPDLADMGSTCVVLLIRNKKAYYAHLGDSRLYFIRDGVIKQLTVDHSLVQQMLDSKIITEEQARNHPKKNIITKSLGTEYASDPDVGREIKLQKDDYFILCTDGLTNHVSDEEIRKNILENNPEESCKKLVDLANDYGGKDNITVQVIRSNSGYKLDKGEKNLYAAFIMLFFLFAAYLVIYQFSGSENTSEEIKNGVEAPDLSDAEKYKKIKGAYQDKPTHGEIPVEKIKADTVAAAETKKDINTEEAKQEALPAAETKVDAELKTENKTTETVNPTE